VWLTLEEVFKGDTRTFCESIGNHPTAFVILHIREVCICIYHLFEIEFLEVIYHGLSVNYIPEEGELKECVSGVSIIILLNEVVEMMWIVLSHLLNRLTH
jgi:hypothetical protein